MTIPPAEPGSLVRWAVLGAWMTRQRWYANRGALPVLEEVGHWRLDSAEPGVGIVTHLLLDHTVGKPALYQVPLTYRRTPLTDDALTGGAPAGDSPAGGAPAGDSLIGELDGALVYDAPHDPAYTAALLEFMTGEREFDGERVWAIGRRSASAVASGLESRVLTGEQSNTSIVFEREGAAPVICKLFRAIHDGDNPDVELQTALAAAGSTVVPQPVGHVLATWSDRGEPSGRARGHLAFAQEFLPGVEDGWRVALTAAARGDDFSAEARALGVATAGVHATLAATMPTHATTLEDIDAVIDHMHGRLAAAIGEVPAIARFAPAVRDVFALASAAAWPAQQRIHGDLHLGQVLSVPGRGWVLVDFEGEPLRPMRERCRLDTPLRDVAGMLRSFDYVAGALAVSGSADATDWAIVARTAFEEGYSAASGRDLRDGRALVDAFVLDKALYETVYEARNRPGWLSIPVGAIERLSVRVAQA